jgi:type II secretory pathway component PulM
MTSTQPTLSQLYELDETAWLDAMSELIRIGRHSALDYPHLQEYLSDMARRDRKEINSRLAILMLHILKWEFQPEKRSRSWQSTILEQQRNLRFDTQSGVLRKHALEAVEAEYPNALADAVIETGLAETVFPAACPFSLDGLLAFTPAGGGFE